MEDFPTEFDAIVLGTGLPESAVAAALSRVGLKVLHLDRNDYYSGQWASFTFDGLLKWVEQNQPDQDVIVAHNVQVPESEGNVELLFHVPKRASVLKNVFVKSYFRKEAPSSLEDEGEGHHLENKEGLKMSPEIDQCSERDREGVEPEYQVTSNGDSTEHRAEPTSEAKELHRDEMKDSSLSESANGSDATHDAKAKQDSATSDQQHEISNGAVESPSAAVGIEREAVPDVPEAGTPGEVPASPYPVISRQRRPVKPSVSSNMTYEDVHHYYRQFNIDLAPKMILSRGQLVESLITANISHYAEFKVVNRILTYLNGSMENVPCSRSEVFSSKLISVIEKRMLMKFLTFCVEFEDHTQEYNDFKDKPYIEFLQARRLTPNLLHFVIHAIAMVRPDTPTLDGLKATQSFLLSLGRYGNTPFIWPLYGIGELPQAFCRMCAVFGGLYCLRRSAKEIVVDQETEKCIKVISEGQELKCKWLIMEHTYLPSEWRRKSPTMVSRAVFVTDKSVKPSNDECVTLLALPPLHEGGNPVRLFELNHSAMACPRGLFIVHLMSKTEQTAQEDLAGIAQEILHFPADEDDKSSDKPVVLWSLYFNQEACDQSFTQNLPHNVFATSLPGVALNLEQAMQQAKDIFISICGPDEDFLPAVPNPEDIILDDFLTAGNEQDHAGMRESYGQEVSHAATAGASSSSSSDVNALGHIASIGNGDDSEANIGVVDESNSCETCLDSCSTGKAESNADSSRCIDGEASSSSHANALFGGEITSDESKTANNTSDGAGSK